MDNQTLLQSLLHSLYRCDFISHSIPVILVFLTSLFPYLPSGLYLKIYHIVNDVLFCKSILKITRIPSSPSYFVGMCKIVLLWKCSSILENKKKSHASIIYLQQFLTYNNFVPSYSSKLF